MDDLVPITPVNFFHLSLECSPVKPGGLTSLKEHALPDLSDLCAEPYFAKVAMGWNKEGLEFFVEVGQPARRSHYPDVTRGDSVELFIDTRDVKTAGFNTRFCHHFFFLPEAVDDHSAGEITRFRTEDVHELCDPRELRVKTHLKSHNYTLQIGIPAHCLHGYDPEQFDRLGFSYRINRPDGPPQHFSVVSEDYQVEQQPSLWSSVKLVTY
jgi:hypothetical protein